MSVTVQKAFLILRERVNELPKNLVVQGEGRLLLTLGWSIGVFCLKSATEIMATLDVAGGILIIIRLWSIRFNYVSIDSRSLEDQSRGYTR